MAGVVAAPGIVPGQADEQVEADQQRDAERAVDTALQQGGRFGFSNHARIVGRSAPAGKGGGLKPGWASS